jgi:hypothetical protein
VTCELLYNLKVKIFLASVPLHMFDGHDRFLAKEECSIN